ncbi:hypothetical protein BDV96DRAFT_652833 [Lophiotrema nucula]|uniref:Rhodopsin domain-containing protein n=1 Tax=Lophiotrema nucula TaxID=690887 RepID=A0A6A5YNE6_9PLEO|nr:hypothetical protein BDV96DRAFT_652833 [Lophiotrema nucula]
MASSLVEGAIPPPPGVTPILGHAESPLRTTYSAALCVMLVFPATLVSLRLYTKTFLVWSWRKTDVACLVGFLWYIALIAVAFVVLNVGMGSHAWNLSPSTFSRLVELLNIHQIIYMPSITFTKIAILLQLKDIFSPLHLARNPRWYLLYAMIVLNCVFFTVLLLLEIFQCIPRHKIWHHKAEGRCIDIKKTFVATGVINVVDDFIILVIPLVWTWQMQLRTRQKVGVSLIFATGLFACVTSVVRLAKSIQCLGSPDISYTFAPVLLWA